MSLPDNLSPVFISSPLGRSGTTLLQRLLSNSHNGICYGENVAHDLLASFNYFGMRLKSLEDTEAINNEYWSVLLEGKTDFWMPDLEFPAKAGGQALLNAALQVPLAAARISAEMGRPVWGVKKPAVGLEELLTPMRYLSHMRVIYIYRDPFETLRSYKSRGWLEDSKKVEEYATRWVVNTAFIEEFEQLNDDAKQRLHLVRYEDFVAEAQAGIEALARFTGVTGISREEAEVKVNTFPGKSLEHVTSRAYVAPLSLTDAEKDTVMEICGERAAALYPEKYATSAA